VKTTDLVDAQGFSPGVRWFRDKSDMRAISTPTQSGRNLEILNEALKWPGPGPTYGDGPKPVMDRS
jgi:hypothetical protein